MSTVLVTSEDVFEDHGTVAICRTPTVTFAGDRRTMAALADAVLEQGEIQAEVEDWQVLG